jgi:hypothetical protein
MNLPNTSKITEIQVLLDRIEVDDLRGHHIIIEQEIVNCPSARL